MKSSQVHGIISSYDALFLCSDLSIDCFFFLVFFYVQYFSVHRGRRMVSMALCSYVSDLPSSVLILFLVGLMA